jgi:phytoene synthase
MQQYAIDPALFRSVIRGQRDDLNQARFHTFDELHTYCYRVASTVGMLCISVWGHDHHPDVWRLAEWRGVALQLTNILRDLRADMGAGRLYLPAAELRQFNCRPERWRVGGADAGFEPMMQFQIERARRWYEASRPLEAHIAADCRATSRAIEALYRGLLERIAAAPRRVLHQRVSLRKIEKLRIASRAWLDQRRSRTAVARRS